MRSIIKLAAFGVVALGTSAIANESGSLDPTGTWLTEDSRAKIHIEKCGDDHKNICGVVAWTRESQDEKGHPKLDVKNPDPAKRTRSVIGMPIMEGLKPDEDAVYSGEIYNADNGKNYDVTLKVEKPSDLHVKGCMLSILCGSQHWTRVADVPPTVVATTQKKSKAAATPQQ